MLDCIVGDPASYGFCTFRVCSTSGLARLEAQHLVWAEGVQSPGLTCWFWPEWDGLWVPVFTRALHLLTFSLFLGFTLLHKYLLVLPNSIGTSLCCENFPTLDIDDNTHNSVFTSLPPMSRWWGSRSLRPHLPHLVFPLSSTKKMISYCSWMNEWMNEPQIVDFVS